MSDDEGGRSKQQGYRLEYATSGRAGCKGPKPCGKDNKIAKGMLRFGSIIDYQGNTSFAWRHIGCLTRQVISNVKKLLGDDVNDIDGFEDLNEDDQALVTRIFEQGEPSREDKPECARLPVDEDGNEIKPGRAKKVKAVSSDGAEPGEDAKPNVAGASSEMEDVKPAVKAKKAPKPKKEKAKPELDEDGNPIKKKGGRIAVKAAGNGGGTSKKPATKAKTKPAAKGKGKKRKVESGSEEEAEDSAEETPAEESDQDSRPAKKSKKSRKAKDESDSEGIVVPREASTRVRRATKKSLKEASASEDEDEKPDIKRGSSVGSEAENGGAEASTSANVKDEEDDE